jgi:hypothetical protein
MDNNVTLIFVLMLLIILSLLTVIGMNLNRYSETKIKELTDKFLDDVVVKNDPIACADNFCKNASLLATVSQTIRTGDDILTYFNFFAKLPEITTTKREFTTYKVSNNVWLNIAFVDFKWKNVPSVSGEPEYTEVSARMTFLYKNGCIFNLHSSQLPAVNASLRSLG